MIGVTSGSFRPAGTYPISPHDSSVANSAVRLPEPARSSTGLIAAPNTSQRGTYLASVASARNASLIGGNTFSSPVAAPATPGDSAQRTLDGVAVTAGADGLDPGNLPRLRFRIHAQRLVVLVSL